MQHECAIHDTVDFTSCTVVRTCRRFRSAPLHPSPSKYLANPDDEHTQGIERNPCTMNTIKKMDTVATTSRRVLPTLRDPVGRLDALRGSFIDDDFVRECRSFATTCCTTRSVTAVSAIHTSYQAFCYRLTDPFWHPIWSTKPNRLRLSWSRRIT